MIRLSQTFLAVSIVVVLFGVAVVATIGEAIAGMVRRRRS